MKKALHKMTAIFAAALSIMSVGLLPVTAANTSNTYWTVNGNVFTEYREKTDKTSVYVKNSTANPVTVSVYGAAGANTRTYPVSSCSSSSTTFKTTGLYLPGNCERLIRQYVKENEYSHAMIYISGTSNGAWSPDSIGNYPSLN